jgi:hypothetical protein
VQLVVRNAADHVPHRSGPAAPACGSRFVPWRACSDPARNAAASTRSCARARHGHSGALVIRGEPGAGKTVLLDHTQAAAAGTQVIGVDAVETEMQLSFAAPHQLLRPGLARVDALPAPQRTALRLAFGMQQGRTPDRFLVSLAAMALLAGQAARQSLARAAPPEGGRPGCCAVSSLRPPSGRYARYPAMSATNETVHRSPA